MNKEEPYRNQAERLRRRIEKINEIEPENHEQLPPRERVHRHKRSKTKWKLKYPVIRLLVLFFILLPIIIFSVISYNNDKKMGDLEKTSGKSSGYETVNFENSNPENDPDLVDNGRETPIDQVDKTDYETDNDPVQKTENTEMSNEKQDSKESSPIEQPTESNNEAQVETVNNSTHEQPTPTNSSTIVYHTVQPKENLYRISLKYYKSKAGEDIIKKANNLQNESIFVGQVLKIPLNQSK